MNPEIQDRKLEERLFFKDDELLDFISFLAGEKDAPKAFKTCLETTAFSSSFSQTKDCVRSSKLEELDSIYEMKKGEMKERIANLKHTHEHRDRIKENLTLKFDELFNNPFSDFDSLSSSKEFSTEEKLDVEKAALNDQPDVDLDILKSFKAIRSNS
jgi:hypothetical protein